MRSGTPISILVLCFLYFLPTAIAKKGNVPKAFASMPPSSIKHEDSAVLKELKDTIKKQAAEIDALRKKTGHNAPSSISGGGHGPPVTDLGDIGLYLRKPFYEMAMQRVGWLSLFLASLSLTAVIMNGFEHTLSRQIELAYFVPLLAGHGGNTGGQVVGTVLSALSSGAVSVKDAYKVVAKEAMSGLMVGCILGTCVATIAHYLMGISSAVAVVIFATLPLVSTIAATLGSTIPFACVAVGLDPSVIAAPAMTSFVDVTGLLSYFLLANKVFELFGLEL